MELILQVENPILDVTMLEGDIADWRKEGTDIVEPVMLDVISTFPVIDENVIVEALIISLFKTFPLNVEPYSVLENILL